MTAAIGQQLRQKREERLLSLEQAAQATRIRERYLRALEDEDLDTLPSLAHVRGFLRAYASYLQLDPEPLLDDLDASLALETSPTSTPLAAPNREGEAASQPLIEVEAILREVGARLQGQRELLGLSLQDVERHTHLRLHYLRALENGQLDDLPSPVQGRGMLKNYAAFLGMDPEPLLLRFADALQSRLAAAQAARPELRPHPARTSRPLPAPVRRFLSSEWIIGSILVLAIAAFMMWGAIRIFALRSAQQGAPTPTAPSIAEVLLAPGTATLTPTPQTPTPIQALPLPAESTPGAAQSNSAPQVTLDAGSSLQVYITVVQRAWLRVAVDGKIEFEGRVLPGTAYQFGGQESVEILTGNGAALQVFYGQRDLGLMGSFGQVVSWIFTREGLFTPTPPPSPSPSPTPRISPTPTVQVSGATATPQSTAIPNP